MIRIMRNRDYELVNDFLIHHSKHLALTNQEHSFGLFSIMNYSRWSCLYGKAQFYHYYGIQIILTRHLYI